MSAPSDTIVALATPPGPAARVIVRISGPASADVVRAVFTADRPLPPVANQLIDGQLTLPGLAAPLDATLYFWHAPRSYTGEDVAEFHVIGCPPITEALVSTLLAVGCRAAGPGEFTQRAFLAGKLDLTRAEAVHAVIEAADRAELKQALGQLAGGMARPMAELREDLLNLLADVEAGLDFADEDIEIVSQRETLLRLTRALAQVTLVGRQLDSRSLTRRAFRAVLAGRPNVGKSSLFNALAGRQALVSPTPGTTRDYLSATIRLGGVSIELIDTPGRQQAEDGIEEQAQRLGAAQTTEADLMIFCLAVGEELIAEESDLVLREHPPSVIVGTKADLALPVQAESATVVTSVLTGEGLDDLRQVLVQHAVRHCEPALAPSVSRCKHHVARCLDHLRRAHAIVLESDPPEILALELREALHQLGEMVGAVYTDDLLDRIFSRFCIGK